MKALGITSTSAIADTITACKARGFIKYNAMRYNRMIVLVQEDNATVFRFFAFTLHKTVIPAAHPPAADASEKS